jgi:hypothetical protein
MEVHIGGQTARPVNNRKQVGYLPFQMVSGPETFVSG